MDKKILAIRTAATIIIVIWLGYSLSIRTDPAERKHFFEVIHDGSNSMKITVTGSDWY